jgi:outer membrane protein assembly factor BamB
MGRYVIAFVGWSNVVGNSYNNRWAITNEHYNSTTIANIVQHCQIEFEMGISATPVTSGDFTYFPTWGGFMVAVNYKTCDILWQSNVTEVIANFAEPTALQKYSQAAVSRTSPQIDGDVLYYGTQINALLVAVDANTGDFLGSIQINDHPVAQVSMSPTFYAGTGMLYVGTSSEEEMAIVFPDGTGSGYTCCDFVGNFGAFKFDKTAKKWTQVWNIDMIGDSKTDGFAGIGLWGSQPSIDSIRNQVFFATGNLYSMPDSYRTCTTTACMPTDVKQESIFAVDLDTGNVNWVRTISALDVWTFSCQDPYATLENNALCPYGPGLDADFAMSPTFVPASLGDNVFATDSILIGQKSGTLMSLSASDGTYQWGTLTGPANDQGGLAWGIAVDDSMLVFLHSENDADRLGRTLMPSTMATLHGKCLPMETQSPMELLGL